MMNFCDRNIPQKTSFRASKQLQKFRTRKTAKNSKLSKLLESCFEPAGKGGWPPISTWITLLADNSTTLLAGTLAQIEKQLKLIPLTLSLSRFQTFNKKSFIHSIKSIA
jgi:hypothetical protein